VRSSRAGTRSAEFLADRISHFLSGDLAEGISRGALLPEGSLELTNSFGEQGYGGPKPPRGSGPHQYVVTLYALSVDRLPVSSTTRFSEVMQMAQSSLLATASTTGIFEQ
jgi:phosphatidylethanolamine-binding protein (PEBP) family uncharacterized protein